MELNALSRMGLKLTIALWKVENTNNSMQFRLASKILLFHFSIPISASMQFNIKNSFSVNPFLKILNKI